MIAERLAQQLGAELPLEHVRFRWMWMPAGYVAYCTVCPWVCGGATERLKASAVEHDQTHR